MSNGGRWIFSVSGQPVILGINNYIAPIFPFPQNGAYNIEVFTSLTQLPPVGTPDPMPPFVAAIADPGGTIEGGFLTGTEIRLGFGDFLAVDSVTGAANQGPSKIFLGGGNQTVVGAKGDTLIGGAGNQIMNALAGNETVLGGVSRYDRTDSIWGGANDSIVAGVGVNQQIIVTGTGTTVVAGIGGSAVMSLAAQNTVTALPGAQQVVIKAGVNNLIDLTGNVGFASAVIGAMGDTIIANGSSAFNVDGSAGGMQIKVGATSGFLALSGSTNPLAGNTVTAADFLGPSPVKGGAYAIGGFGYNPGPVAGKGDLINLSGGTAYAQVNAFSFQGTRIAAPDTIMATSTNDSVFGGHGDRIGTAQYGTGPGSSTLVGGMHQWTHADTVAGSAVGFGSNDTVSSTAYDTVAHTATRNPTVPGSSFAQVTVGGFNTTSDFLFYQNETAATTSAIIATSQATTVNGTASTVITLPDGTVMTLVGITQAQLTPGLFKL